MLRFPAVRVLGKSVGILMLSALAACGEPSEPADDGEGSTGAIEYPFEGEGEDDPECVVETSTRVRAEAGSSCEDYKAEISAEIFGCVKECAELETKTETVRLGMFACAEWCGDRGCPTVTFEPLEKGCAEYLCFETETCPAECPFQEQCTLLDANELWNCFCQDRVKS